MTDQEITEALNRVYEEIDSSLDPAFAVLQGMAIDTEWDESDAPDPS